MTRLEAVKEHIRTAKNELVRAVLGLEMEPIHFKNTIIEIKQVIGDLHVTEQILELHIEQK